MKTLFLLFALSLSAFAQHSVTLSWVWTQGTGGTATGFIVQRGTVTGGPYTTICGITGQPACPLVGVLTYLDASTAVASGGTFFYVVEATGPGGVSPQSNESKAVVPFLPPQSASGLQSVVN
jgi:hypothetical protein